MWRSWHRVIHSDRHYRGRIGANAICAKAVAANYLALPRAVYTDAGVCSIGIGFGAAMKVGVETEESQPNSS